MSQIGWGKVIVRVRSKAAWLQRTATDLQRMWSIYSLPDQMETIKPETRQPSLYQFFTLSTHKLWGEKKKKRKGREKTVPCFLPAQTLPLSFYWANSHPHAWQTHRMMLLCSGHLNSSRRCLGQKQWDVEKLSWKKWESSGLLLLVQQLGSPVCSELRTLVFTHCFSLHERQL